jgi:hypothetical protein
MRVVLALIALLVTSGPVLADNPYAAAGISDPAHVTQFLARLKQAVAADGGGKQVSCASSSYFLCGLLPEFLFRSGRFAIRPSSLSGDAAAVWKPSHALARLSRRTSRARLMAIFPLLRSL